MVPIRRKIGSAPFGSFLNVPIITIPSSMAAISSGCMSKQNLLVISAREAVPPLAPTKSATLDGLGPLVHVPLLHQILRGGIVVPELTLETQHVDEILHQ